MRFEPIADDGALRALQYLSTDSEDDSAYDHDPKHVLQSSQTEDELTDDAEHACNDENYPRADAIDKGTSYERNDDVGEGVDGIQQIKLGLSKWFVIGMLIIMLNELLERLHQ